MCAGAPTMQHVITRLVCASVLLDGLDRTALYVGFWTRLLLCKISIWLVFDFILFCCKTLTVSCLTVYTSGKYLLILHKYSQDLIIQWKVSNDKLCTQLFLQLVCCSQFLQCAWHGHQSYIFFSSLVHLLQKNTLYKHKIIIFLFTLLISTSMKLTSHKLWKL